MKMVHDSETFNIPERLPVIPVRDVVVFPHMMYPLLIGREFTVNALQEAMVKEKLVLLLAQRSADIDSPEADDLYTVGVVARILQVMKMPNGMLKVLVEGLVRAEVAEISTGGRFIEAEVDVVSEDVSKHDRETEALSRTVGEKFAEYVRLNRRIPDEVLVSLATIEDYQQQADTVAAHLIHKLETKQKLLEALSVRERLVILSALLKEEIEILNLEQEIDGTVRESMSRSQREFYLQQQLKAIKEELGQYDDPGTDVDDLLARLESGNYPDRVKTRAEEEIKKLSRMHPFAAESGVVRSYLEWLLVLPWEERSEDRLDFKGVRSILDGDHFGLEKPKQRILEHLAVMRLAGKVRGPIICLVGPPGVGKTSVGRSIARALDRQFARMSLGGVHDEAEIRGHRRTYIGAMPGRIIQSIKKVKSSNPVFLLDEIDKIGSDFRGDPASALLEVLDPEQNCTFIDNYIEVEYDLSDILFITTANTTSSIPPALKDRMEIINLPGYLDFEKAAIARDFLTPKLKKMTGLADIPVTFDDDAIYEIIRRYTREAGVRELERQMAAVMRKTAVGLADGKRVKRITYKRAKVSKILGAPRYTGTSVKSRPTVGYAVGLAWTELGGEVLPVEVVPMKGKAKLTLTGSLGDVMQESATAALSYIRNHAVGYGLSEDFFENLELHVHIPEGAVPKDGPSAGVTLLAAMLSSLTGVPVRTDLAMTGEITLTGDVLPVGGLNEKLLAAKRLGIDVIVLPEKNRRDVSELQAELLKGMKLHYVRTVAAVLKQVLTEKPAGQPKRRATGSRHLGAGR
jgi:ATP-dependent Lon protease